MIFTETALPGAHLIALEPLGDERGEFVRVYCREEFAHHGLDPTIAQCSLSRNRLRGTLRGLHYQVPPHAETKLVRCTRGALYDVIVDLRPAAPTYGQWLGVELSADNGLMLYVPAGFAHGFLTLADDTEVAYQMSTFYAPAAARGVRWNDPTLAIRWPAPPRVISPRDRALPDFRP